MSLPDCCAEAGCIEWRIRSCGKECRFPTPENHCPTGQSWKRLSYNSQSPYPNKTFSNQTNIAQCTNQSKDTQFFQRENYVNINCIIGKYRAWQQSKRMSRASYSAMYFQVAVRLVSLIGSVMETRTSKKLYGFFSHIFMYSPHQQ